MMAQTMRCGFIDPAETDDLQLPSKVDREKQGLPPLSKAQAVRDLRRAGYTIGREVDFDSDTGVLTDVRRSGKIAHGFAAKDGYDLREVDDWTPQEKARLTRVYNQVKTLSERPYQIVRPRKAENLERLQGATAPFKMADEIDVAFVPVARPGEEVDIRYTKTDVVIKEQTYEVETVEFQEREVTWVPVYWADLGLTPSQVEADVPGAVQKVVDAFPAEAYTMMAGATFMTDSHSPDELVAEIQYIIDWYPRWEQFLLGVQAWTFFPKQADLADYRRDKRKAKKGQERQSKKDKARFRKRVKGKKQRKR